jgi:hypothetical protein
MSTAVNWKSMAPVALFQPVTWPLQNMRKGSQERSRAAAACSTPQGAGGAGVHLPWWLSQLALLLPSAGV